MLTPTPTDPTSRPQIWIQEIASRYCREHGYKRCSGTCSSENHTPSPRESSLFPPAIPQRPEIPRTRLPTPTPVRRTRARSRLASPSHRPTPSAHRYHVQPAPEKKMEGKEKGKVQPDATQFTPCRHPPEPSSWRTLRSTARRLPPSLINLRPTSQLAT